MSRHAFILTLPSSYSTHRLLLLFDGIEVKKCFRLSFLFFLSMAHHNSSRDKKENVLKWKEVGCRKTQVMSFDSQWTPCFFLFLFRSWTRILSSSIWKKKKKPKLTQRHNGAASRRDNIIMIFSFPKLYFYFFYFSM
jgi:hypothetical protein